MKKLLFSSEAPVFVKELEDVAVTEGDAVTLEVVVSGEPKCKLEWFMNGMDLTEGGRHSFVNHGEGRYSLVIRDVRDDDDGQYCCAAQNEAGRVTCDGFVTVEADTEPLGVYWKMSPLAKCMLNIPRSWAWAFYKKM